MAASAPALPPRPLLFFRLPVAYRQAMDSKLQGKLPIHSQRQVVPSCMQHESSFAISPPFSELLLTLSTKSVAVQLTNGRCKLPLQVATGAPGIGCLDMVWFQLQHSCEVSNGFIQLAHFFRDSAPAAGVVVMKAGVL